MRLLRRALYSLILAVVGMPARSSPAASADRVRCAECFAGGAVTRWTLAELMTVATSDELASAAIRELPRLDLRGALLEPANIPHREYGSYSDPPSTVIFEGRTHFVKVMRYNGRAHVALTAREAFWLVAVNRLGLGPRFRGLIEIGDGGYGIVMAYVPGRLWAPDTTPPEMPSMSSAQLSFIATQLTRTQNVLSENGINAFDLQFLVDTDGRLTLIDVGFFERQGPSSPRARADDEFEVLRMQLNQLRRSRRRR